MFHYSSLISKKLATPIDVRQVEGPIGKPLPGGTPAGARLVSHERLANQGSRDTFDLNGDGRADLVRTVEDGPAFRRVSEENRDTGEKRIYLGLLREDGTAGPIKYYVEKKPQGEITMSADENGRLDWVSEQVTRIPGFKPEGYEQGWHPDRVYNRVLEDKDHDGKFETESVTGDWFRTTPLAER